MKTHYLSGFDYRSIKCNWGWRSGWCNRQRELSSRLPSLALAQLAIPPPGHAWISRSTKSRPEKNESGSNFGGDLSAIYFEPSRPLCE